MATADAFNVKEPVMVDETIRIFQHRRYNLGPNVDLNTAGNLIIDVPEQSNFALPSEAYLVFEGRLFKTDGTSYADTDVVTLAHNGIMHLFNSISYSLSGREIEFVSHPGQAATIFGMLKYPNANLAKGLNQLWVKDSGSSAASLTANAGFALRQDYIIKSPDPNGSFQFVVPLEHIFGFCDDYDKVVFGFKHTIALNRKIDDEAIFRASAVPAGKVNLTKIALDMPYVAPQASLEAELSKEILATKELQAAYRVRRCELNTIMLSSSNFAWRLSLMSNEKPRFVIVGFQTDRSGSQEKNPSVFDHCDLRDISVTLNGLKYPADIPILSFAQNNFAIPYRAASKFCENFYGLNDINNQCSI